MAARELPDADLHPVHHRGVVLGGNDILGGRGTYSGTVAGVLLLTLLSSMLSVLQIQKAGRQIVYSGVVIVMLLVYARGGKIQG